MSFEGKTIVPDYFETIYLDLNNYFKNESYFGELMICHHTRFFNFRPGFSAIHYTKYFL